MTQPEHLVTDLAHSVIVRDWGIQAYPVTYQAMRDFTEQRKADTPDELWLLQHTPVYTLGQAGRREHILNPKDIPIVPVDRGGQVTYHGLGQLVVYLLIDLKRRPAWGVKKLVDAIEQAVIDFLASHQQLAERREKAPGVYVQQRKIAALGLRVRQGCSYHGLSLNIDMDLSPFSGINPCGYEGLEVTQVRDLGIQGDFPQLSQAFLQHLLQQLDYQHVLNLSAPAVETLDLSHDLA